MGARLVRDGALWPGNWTVPGAEHQVRPVTDVQEHQNLLIAKLLEEAGEVITAKARGDLIKELADLLTVMQATAHVHEIEWKQVLIKADMRHAMAGGFTEGLVWETPR